MKIRFANPKHEELVNDAVALSKKYDKGNQKNADEILATLTVLVAAETLAEVPRSYRPHPLKGSLKGHFAVDVTKTHRIVFRPDPVGSPKFRIDNYKTIDSIIVTDIFKDYH